MSAAATLRTAITEGRTVSAPGCFDPLTGLMIQRAGFPAAYLSAWSIHVAGLGLPHLGVASLSEYVDLARRIVNAVEIPLIVDIEHGLGGPLEVRRAVQELGNVGVAAVCINDQTRGMGWMIRSDDVQTGLVSFEQMAAKIGAAKAARSDSDFVVFGRTDATRVSAQEGIDRCNAWVQAGADVAMPMMSPWLGFRGNKAPRAELHGIIRRFVHEVAAPLAVHNAYGLDLSLDEASDIGLGVYIIPQATLGYSAAASWRALTALRSDDLNAFAEILPPMTNDQFGEIVDFDKHTAFAQEFGI